MCSAPYASKSDATQSGIHNKKTYTTYASALVVVHCDVVGIPEGQGVKQ